ncbi:MAG: hypothetical protein IJF71_06420 [Clostridia bacterium]|nr:hypothetical protein [Clostridia bacterium]
MKKFTLASLVLVMALAVLSFGFVTVGNNYAAADGIALTEEIMLQNPNKLLPAPYHPGAERLNIANNQISSWEDGNFYYNDEVDSVQFHFTAKKDSGQSMLFVGLHVAQYSVPWASTGYFAFVQNKVVGLYKIDGSKSNWEEALLAEKVTASTNIFDGNTHAISFAVSGNSLTFSINSESLTLPFEGDPIPVENTELSMSANGPFVYMVGEPAATEKEYTGEYTNLEELIKSGAIRPDYNYDSVGNNYFNTIENGYVLSNGCLMSFSASLTAVTFDITVTEGNSMFFAMRARNGGNIWDMTGGYIVWLNGTTFKFYDASEKWADSPVILTTLDVNIFDRNSHNIRMYAFDDEKGNVHAGFSVDGGAFFKIIDNSNPVYLTEHTEFYMNNVNDGTVRYKVTAPEGTAHAYGEPNVVGPTCTEGGYTEQVCADCKKMVITNETEATGHSYDAVVTEPGCISGGYTTYTCSTCNDSYQADFTEETGHSYEAVVTEPKCGEKGYTTHTCGGCNDSYVDSYVDALEHNFVAGEVVEPSCTAGGHTVYECTNCDATENRDITEQLEHNYVEISRTEATFDNPGEIVYECEHCKDQQTEEIPVLEEAKPLCVASVGTEVLFVMAALAALVLLFGKKVNN